MTLLQSADVLMSVGLAMIIGHKIGFRRGQRRAVVESRERLDAMRRHPSNHIRVIK